MFGAPHTAHDMAVAWLRYLAERTGRTGEEIEDRFFAATGGADIRREPVAFQRWAAAKLPAIDGEGSDPFTTRRTA
jgi:hypothetical protein